MYTMMSLKQIADSASALANQLKANIPVAEAASILADIQPEYAEYWLSVSRAIEAGNNLSSQLHHVWPSTLVSAMVAGEEAGRTDEALARIEATVMLQIDIRNKVMKLGYPIGISIVGVILFFVMMIFVVPLTTAAFGSAVTSNPSFFTSLSMAMSTTAKEYWFPILVAMVLTGFFVIKWLLSDDGKESVLDFFLTVPIMGRAMVNLYFGLWVEYMAMMCVSGIPTIRALLLTVDALPRSLREGVRVFERDLTIRSMSLEQAANPKGRPVTDPRVVWPLYVSRAFMVGDRTGEIDIEMRRAGPILVSDGVKALDRFISVGNLVALAFAGTLIAMSFAAIYMPIFSALRNVR